MADKGRYLLLQDLEIYQLAREISRRAWRIYEALHWQDKKVMGDQFLTASDSVGANLTEGYYRFHFLDKIKFYYNSRGSLAESRDYWIELLAERGKVNEQDRIEFVNVGNEYAKKLNGFIKNTYKVSQNYK